MNEPKAFFILSRYKEDFSWVKEYTNKYIIYNKGNFIEDPHIINTENIGGNQRDIFKYIYDNYSYLPELMLFLQAEPFDHCKKEIFDQLIYNESFTPIEYYGLTPANGWERRTPEGGYMELNNSWYIADIYRKYGNTCKYSSFDEFMNIMFKNYVHLDWIRFSPGSQYLIEKRQALFYPKDFWKRLMEELSKNNAAEGHIIERALWLIFQCTLEIR